MKGRKMKMVRDGIRKGEKTERNDSKLVKP